MSTAQTAEFNTTQPAADETERALPLRSDTFLGVCEAIGQDLGINPNYVRIAFAPFIIINPLLTIAAYLGLGGVVALSRWLFPRQAPQSANQSAANPSVNDDSDEERLAA
jgi:phage shock protein C